MKQSQVLFEICKNDHAAVLHGRVQRFNNFRPLTHPGLRNHWRDAQVLSAGS